MSAFELRAFETGDGMRGGTTLKEIHGLLVFLVTYDRREQV